MVAMKVGWMAVVMAEERAEKKVGLKAKHWALPMVDSRVGSMAEMTAETRVEKMAGRKG